jgi:DNA-binding transcriptional LysR family regulator
MNIFQLDCFLAVADTLSFARAAQKMNISQPAITHQVKALEEELNVKLFRRSTRRVELTLEGQAFITDARSMVSIATQAKKRFRDPEQRPVTLLSVGSSSYHHLACLTESLDELATRVDHLHPRLHAMQHDQLFRMLEDDTLDVIFDIEEESPAKGTALYRELCTSPIVCVCRRGTPLSRWESLTAQQLRKEPIILCDPLGLSPKITEMQLKLAEGRSPTDLHFSSSVDAAVVMAMAGFGAAILPETLLAHSGDELARVPIEDAPSVSLGLFYKAHPGDELVRRFAQIAKKNFAAQGAAPKTTETEA